MSTSRNEDSEAGRRRVVARRVAAGYSIAVPAASIAVGYELGGAGAAIAAGCIAAIAMAAVVVIIRRLYP